MIRGGGRLILMGGRSGALTLLGGRIEGSQPAAFKMRFNNSHQHCVRLTLDSRAPAIVGSRGRIAVATFEGLRPCS